MPAQYPQYIDNDPLVSGRELLDRLPSRLTLEQFNELYWFMSREALRHGYYVKRKEESQDSLLNRRARDESVEFFYQKILARVDILRSQSNKCKTAQGAAAIAAIAEWLNGRYITDGELEPWQIADLWIGRSPDSEPAI